MIIGSGLIARAFIDKVPASTRVCWYAAGVSNSACRDVSEFERDRLRLQTTLAQIAGDTPVVYVSTCSIDDPWMQDSPYIAHKRELEQLVRDRGPHLIVRMPQVAGRTPNPHTLLNYLYNRIARSERFQLWRNCYRNVIDAQDAAAIVVDLIEHESVWGETINVASPHNSSVAEIVAAMEQITRRAALYDEVDKSGGHAIDSRRAEASARRCAISFASGYLLRTLQKYYS